MMVSLKQVASALCLVLLTAVAVQGAADVEKYEFQAEVSRMMDIIINSLYQKKEVFLREIISNAADALDKIRFLSLQKPSEMESEKELNIKISCDEEEKILRIRDTGVGMTKKELIENLGTVAKSGTTNFIEQLANSGDLSLIGQFGVGFYSVYLVSDKVQVLSKNNNEDTSFLWESTAESTFTVSPVSDETEGLTRGTELRLFLKEDAMEYCNEMRLTSLIERYSEFVDFPIYVRKKVVGSSDSSESADEEDEEDLDDDEEEEESQEEEEEEEEEEFEWVLINNQKAIWTRNPNEVTDEEYQSFFKALTKSSSNPLTWNHFKAEGEVEFKSILFVPEKAPYNQYDQYYNLDSVLKLYVRKVLIKDDFKEMLPKYLNFIKGVIDSDDLPLSVSRETLQQAKSVKVIAKKLVKKSLDMLAKMADREFSEDDDDVDTENDATLPKYQDFYTQFGKNIKLGVVEDHNNKDRLVGLLRYKTTKTESGEAPSVGGMTSLAEYVKRMQDFQKNIFYLTGSSIQEMVNSPFLKIAKAKDIEVILMDDAVDEYVLQQLKDFEGHQLMSLAKDGVKFGDETEDLKLLEDEYKKEFKELTKWLKALYNKNSDLLDRITVTTSRIDEKLPAVVVASKHGNSANMERLMMNQALGDVAKQTMAKAVKIMELNPRSPIISKLKDIFEDDEDQAKDIAWLLLDTALVSSGFDISEKPDFASRMFRLMQSGLKLDSLDPLPFIEVPEPVDEEEGEEDTEDDKEEL